MDIRHPLKPIDLEMIKLCESSNINYVAVLTKSDKVSKNISAKTIQQVSEAINAKEILAISSLNKTGFEKLNLPVFKFKLLIKALPIKTLASDFRSSLNFMYFIKLERVIDDPH